jgi:hypothetical protein
MSVDVAAQARAILEEVKPLAIKYYDLTGKPLGVTGEMGELAAAEKLGLKLADARTKGYDALRGNERIQIKARAFKKGARQVGRMGIIKASADYDVLILVLLDRETFEPFSMWQATRAELNALLAKSDAAARKRGQLHVAEFTRNAVQVWPFAVSVS